MSDQPDQSEKTEDPTQKKLDDARKKGDVAKSQEVTTWFAMLAATLLVVLYAPELATSTAVTLKTFLAKAGTMSVDGASLVALFGRTSLAMLGVLAIPFAVMMVAGLAGNLIQHRPLISLDPITPKFSKVSPASGAKRLFSPTSLVNFAKSIAKLCVVSTVIFMVVWPNRDRLDTAVGMPIGAIMTLTHTMADKILIAVICILTVLAVADFAWQRKTWWDKQKMTIKELRDEYKQMEGDPQVRAKIRQIRIERGRKRMMAKVPNAAVVITNPTHYAVALEYEKGMNAPVCVAKGADAVAAKIREIAEANKVPIVENPPLARALHAGVELDEEIPSEHYKAVAEVIGFVMKLRSARTWQAS